MSDIQARFQLQRGAFNLDVDFQLPGDGVAVVFGESGSGKSTFLRCVAGLEKASQAYLKVNEQCWHDSENRVFIPACKRRCGFVFQDACLFPHLTVQQNIMFGFKRRGRRQIKLNPDDMMAQFCIKSLLHKMPDQLSGGQKQRVAIVRALLSQPELLLLDEPINALDKKAKQQVMSVLRDIQQHLKMPMIYVTHSIEERDVMGDCVLEMGLLMKS